MPETCSHLALQDLCLPSRANQVLTALGMDSEKYCRDRNHFHACRDQIDYKFNSRGFRDQEWPHDVDSAIWCVGDSYTVGIGQPFAAIWPQQLATITGKRTINISMDGASNAWIARRAQQILHTIQPAVMILHWSFLHRREDADADLTDELRRVWHSKIDDDLDEFQRCVSLVEQARGHSLVLHSTIPLFSPNAVVRQVFLRRCVGDRALPELVMQDHGRDGYHYGPKTTQQLVNNVLAKINMQDVVTLMAP